MLTNCKDDLPNPHKDCLHDTLNALICQENDLRRINVLLRDLQRDYESEMEKLEIKQREFRKSLCDSDESLNEFTTHVRNIDKMKECFENRITNYKQEREEILRSAKLCLAQLNGEKCKFKRFHENTVEYLKRYAINSDDSAVIRSCEKDICDMHKLFVKEVSYIKKCENELIWFFKQIEGPDFQDYCKCCCFKDYEWIPKAKTLQVVQNIATDIQELMGNTLIKALAQVHIHQPPDVKSFLAAYLMNLEHNEEILKEKLNLFANFKQNL